MIFLACFALMPRKKTKTEMQPLQFRERPAGEARVQLNLPEVRAAVNPKNFFSEPKAVHNGSTLKSWISPQFDTSAVATLPVKRGRKKCVNSTSITNFSQLSRKSNVSKFPTLLFETKPREQNHHLKHTQRKKASDIAESSSNHQQIIQTNSMACNVQKSGTVKKDQSPNNNRTGNKKYSKKERKRSTVEDCSNSDAGPQFPDVVTPEVTQGYSTHSHALNLLQSPPRNLSCSRILDSLVPDTPERDYGLKVTWRRRKKLMLLLKEKGHLSDTDTVIHI